MLEALLKPSISHLCCSYKCQRKTFVEAKNRFISQTESKKLYCRWVKTKLEISLSLRVNPETCIVVVILNCITSPITNHQTRWIRAWTISQKILVNPLHFNFLTWRITNGCSLRDKPLSTSVQFIEIHNLNSQLLNQFKPY